MIDAASVLRRVAAQRALQDVSEVLECTGIGLQAEDASPEPMGRVRIQRRARQGKRRVSLDGSAVERDVIVVQTAVEHSQRDEISDPPAGSRRIRIDLAAQNRPAGGCDAVHLAVLDGDLAQA